MLRSAAANTLFALTWTTVLAGSACLAAYAADDSAGSSSVESYEEYDIPDPFRQTSQATQPRIAPQPQIAPQPSLQGAPRAASPLLTTQPAAPSSFAASENIRSMFASRYRLASTPEMFGDFFGRGGTITATDGLAVARLFAISGRADLAWAGGSRGLKVGEHNKALPVDRVYFNYNHYHNALTFAATGINPGPQAGTPFAAAGDASLDRFTLGLEKTFLCGWASVELRMPLTGGYNFDFNSGDPNGIFTAEGGHVGNFSIIPKLLLFQDDCNALSIGLGIETPTGSDAESRLAFTNYRIENDAVHLHPYVAFMSQFQTDWFVNAFAQVDVATSGNPVQFSAAAGPPGAGTFGIYDEQTLLHLDVSLGRWLYRDPCAAGLTGLAGIVEWHYTTALEDTDVVAGARATAFPRGATFDFRNAANRFDVLNLTAGVHAEIARNTTLRLGAVAPLFGGDDRFFDAEVIAQLSRRF